MKQPLVSGSATAEPDTKGAQRPVRRLVTVGGVVQGVGFRPFVHALATELGLSGQVANGSAGARIEIEGGTEAVAAFCHRLTTDVPPLADIASVATSELPPTGGTGFAIVPSLTGHGRTLVPPDAATCDACLTELADPADRRHRHPFITCTDCGPRFTITTALPYDRATTTMAAFPMCPDCTAEYTDASDRRFHAQPIACWACGPRLRLTGAVRREGGAALAEARRMLAAGAIVAVKGLGGYHLVCDASAPGAVGELRRRKARGDKPFAVMTPDADTAARLATSALRSAASWWSGPAPSCCCAADPRLRSPRRCVRGARTSGCCCPTPRCTGSCSAFRATHPVPASWW